jgi:hypothetical protein
LEGSLSKQFSRRKSQQRHHLTPFLTPLRG